MGLPVTDFLNLSEFRAFSVVGLASSTNPGIPNDAEGNDAERNEGQRP